MVNRQSVEADLQAWAADILKCEVAVAPLAGDASFRRYYRLQTEQGGYIAAHAPPERENNEAFVAVQGLLASHGVRVPGLIAWQRERGFLLQRDFGDQLLLPSLTEDTVELQYQAALDALLTLQSIPVSDAELPLYGEQKLREELDLFAEWFVTQLLGVEQSAVPHGLLDELFELLIASARSQPQVVVHRDYHSRNLMVLEDGELGVIDFQDAVVGPITYDLVSLLRDCYVEWPEAQVAGWALGYRDQLLRAERMPPCSDEQFLRWFDLMGLQRHIKVLGIFARLWLRDGKSGYLQDLPLVIRYTLRVAARYPECAPFVAWFKGELEPRIAEHSWS